MGCIVSRDCSISVTVSRENTKNFTVKREEKILFIVSEHFSADSKIYTSSLLKCQNFYC